MKTSAGKYSILFCLLIAVPVGAQIDYPAEIQAKFDSGQYIELNRGELGHAVPGFSDDIGMYVKAIDLDDLDSNVLIIRYPIAAGSESFSSGSSTQPFTGFAFVEGRDEYNLDERNATFDLYLEKVKPSVLGNFAFKFETIDLEFITKAAAINGEGSYCYEFTDVIPKYATCDPVCESSLQDLFSNNMPIVCLGDCCGNSATFRLPGIQFVDAGTGANRIVFEPVTEFDFAQPDFNLLYYHDSFSTEIDSAFVSSQRFEIPLFQVGDANMDGEVNLLDVPAFVECLTIDFFRYQCDTNGDLDVNLLDIPGFVDLIAGN